jgi:hypothetical protein
VNTSRGSQHKKQSTRIIYITLSDNTIVKNWSYDTVAMPVPVTSYRRKRFVIVESSARENRKGVSRAAGGATGWEVEWRGKHGTWKGRTCIHLNELVEPNTVRETKRGGNWGTTAGTPKLHEPSPFI